MTLQNARRSWQVMEVLTWLGRMETRAWRRDLALEPLLDPGFLLVLPTFPDLDVLAAL